MLALCRPQSFIYRSQDGVNTRAIGLRISLGRPGPEVITTKPIPDELLSTRAQEELKHDQVFPVLRGRATIENHSIRGRLANMINPIWVVLPLGIAGTAGTPISALA